MSRGGAPLQGDRKGPHSAPLHSRPYKDDEKDEELLRVFVRAGAGADEWMGPLRSPWGGVVVA